MTSLSVVVQKVKRLSAMRKTRIRSLGQEDPLEKEVITTPVFLPGESPWTEEPGELQSMVCKKLDTTEAT